MNAKWKAILNTSNDNDYIEDQYCHVHHYDKQRMKALKRSEKYELQLNLEENDVLQKLKCLEVGLELDPWLFDWKAKKELEGSGDVYLASSTLFESLWETQKKLRDYAETYSILAANYSLPTNLLDGKCVVLPIQVAKQYGLCILFHPKLLKVIF